jgi:hypothetical protein
MVRAFSIVFFGLAPILLGAAELSAAGKTIDMGYIDQATVRHACQQAGTVPFTGAGQYGCRTRNASITCDQEGCKARGSDLNPVTGNSLGAVLDAIDQRAGRRIMPLDNRVEPTNRRVQ